MFGISKKIKEMLPKGSFLAMLALSLSSITSYLIVIIANNKLNSTEYKFLSVLWAIIFIIGPGLFHPIEQIISSSLQQHKNKKKVIDYYFKKTLILNLYAIVLLCAFTLAYRMDFSTFIVIAVGIVSFSCLYFIRGLATGTFSNFIYSLLILFEGLSRFFVVLTIAYLFKINNAILYLAALSITPLFSLLFTKSLLSKSINSNMAINETQKSSRFRYLILASCISQTFAYSPLLAVNYSYSRSFTNAFFISRIPILLFLSIQGLLLPILASQTNQKDIAKKTLDTTLKFVISVCSLGLFFVYFIGVYIGKILFGKNSFNISSINLTILCLSSIFIIIAQYTSQLLIAKQKNYSQIFIWIIGLIIYWGMILTNFSVSYSFLFSSIACAIFSYSLIIYYEKKAN